MFIEDKSEKKLLIVKKRCGKSYKMKICKNITCINKSSSTGDNKKLIKTNKNLTQ